jgi:hypothetical protein
VFSAGKSTEKALTGFRAFYKLNGIEPCETAETPSGFLQITATFTATGLQFAVTDSAIGYCIIGRTEVMGTSFAAIAQALAAKVEIQWTYCANLTEPLAYFGRGADDELVVNTSGKDGITYELATFRADGDDISWTFQGDAVRSTQAQPYDDVVIGASGVLGGSGVATFGPSGLAFRDSSQFAPELLALIGGNKRRDARDDDAAAAEL